MVAEPLISNSQPTEEKFDILKRRCLVKFKSGECGRNVTEKTLPWYFVSVIEAAGFISFSAHLNPLENENFDAFASRVCSTCAQSTNTSKLELYFKATRAQRHNNESVPLFSARMNDMWTKIPREMSLFRISNLIKLSNLLPTTDSSGNSFYKTQEVETLLSNITFEVNDVNFCLQTCTILLGLRNDNWALQALANVNCNTYNPKKIEDYLLRTQHLLANIVTPSASQVFLSPSQHASSFISTSDETSLVAFNKTCEHKREKKSCWKCNPCSSCNRKGACEHRRTRNRFPMTEKSMLATLIAQAENSSSKSKTPTTLLHRRIVIFDSGCSTAMVSRGWLKNNPELINNITKNPTIHFNVGES